MNQLQLYINDQLVDLNDDSPIALTFQINDLAEVKNQQGNTSNRFKLPLSQRNRRILGFPDDVAFATAQPYQQYQAKIIQDGLEILPFGIGEINSIEQDNINITILSGNVDFFDAIDGKLYDMGDSTSQWSNFGQNLVWKPYDHIWNLQNAATSQKKTDGWIYPVIDYGYISGNDFTQPIDVHNLRPGFFIKTAIDLLLQSAGYKGAGSLLNDPLYPLLICQFSNGTWDHGTDYQNQPDTRGCSVGNGMSMVLDHPNNDNPDGVLSWNIITSDPSHQFANNTAYVATQPNSILATLTLPQVRMTGKITGKHPTHLTVYFKIHTASGDVNQANYDFTWDLGTWVNTNGGNGGNIAGYVDIFDSVISFQTSLATGESISVGYTWLGDNPSSFIISPGATFVVQSQNQSVVHQQTIQCERIFPDISQKDLLKDTLQRFGIICQTDNATKTVFFNSLRDIVNNIPVAKDWTAKCVDQGKQVAFQLGNYGQVNTMKYKADDNVLPAGFADSQINISDTTLQATVDLFDSQFAPTLNRPYFTGTIAQIKMIDSKSGTNDFTTSVSPRILVDQKTKLPSNKTVTFTDGTPNNKIVVNDVISTPYFYKPDGAYNICFNDQPGLANNIQPGLKTKYYPEFQKILTQTKKITRYIMLTPRDILELDLMIPVYLQQDNAYFYINKIDSWRKGQPCKVELVKLG